MNARTLGLTIASLGLLGALPCATPQNLGEGLETAKKVGDKAGEGFDLAKEHAKCDALAKVQVSYQEEYALGGTAAVGFVKSNGGLALPYTDAESDELKKQESVKFNESSADFKTAKYVATVGKNLGFQSSRPDIKWTVGVLKNDSQVNAFSAPGGYVLITRGALKAAKNEDQLAGILAHEIGHIVKKHGIKYYTNEKIAGCKVVKTLKSDAAQSLKDEVMSFIPAIYDLEQLASSYGRLLSTGADAINFDDRGSFDFVQMLGEKAGAKIAEGYSQDMELEADQVAADLLMSAGYSVDEYGKFVSTLSGSKTHPGGAERQKALMDYAKKKRTSDDFSGPESKRKPIPLATAK
jgi:hypothetical protein